MCVGSTEIVGSPGMNWVLVIAPAVASGALGSIVTTYGSQARERREARAKVRACLLQAEWLALSPEPDPDKLRAALDEVEVTMLTASVPYYVILFYRAARKWANSAYMDKSGGEEYKPTALWVVSARIAEAATSLALQVIWHPWLTAPTRRWRVRRLRAIVVRIAPEVAEAEFPPSRTFREWERELRRR